MVCTLIKCFIFISGIMLNMCSCKLSVDISEGFDSVISVGIFGRYHFKNNNFITKSVLKYMSLLNFIKINGGILTIFMLIRSRTVLVTGLIY